MSTSLHVPGLPGGTTIREDDERWALVLRVVSSRHLVKAQQLRDILLYICHRGLASESAAIREHEIACEVLGRRADFDPHEDNIVRVQISHLRKRLEDYFAGEGQGEALRLTIPKGSYVPRFEAVAQALPVAAPPAMPQPTVRAQPSRRRGYSIALFAICAVAVAAGFYAWLHRTKGTAAVANVVKSESAADRFWSNMFRQPPSIVVADTCLVMLQDLLDTDIPLGEYLNGRFPANLLSRAKTPALGAALRTIASRQYTSLADLNTATNVIALSHRYSGADPRIRYARYLNVRDFKSGNFIIMGSRRGIPWVQLFEQQLNFSLEEDAASKGYFFRNRHPQPGEQDSYRPMKEGESLVETYADVAVVPNLSGSGYVMMLSGIGMESSESAGELVTGPEFSRVLASLAKPGGQPPAYFELLLRTRAVGGAAKNSQVVTYRVP